MEEQVNFSDHLKVLQKTLIRVCIVFCVILVATLFFEEKIINSLLKPLKNSSSENSLGLIVLSPTEGVLTYLKIALWLTLLIVIPYLILEIWLFIKPALYTNEKKILGFILFSSIFLSYCAIICSYFLIIPYFLKFLMEFLPTGIKAQYSLEKYVVFLFSISLGLIITFQTPLVTYGLIKLGIVTRKETLSKWKIIIIVALIVSAVLTPTTDPLSQILLTLPIVILYFLGIIFTLIF